jgi:hypothetical protein
MLRTGGGRRERVVVLEEDVMVVWLEIKMNRGVPEITGCAYENATSLECFERL